MGRRPHPLLEALRGPHVGRDGWAHFRDASATGEAIGLWVTTVGYHRNRARDAVIANRALGCYGAVLVARGRAWLESAPSGRREVHEGELFWTFPEIEHTYAPLTDEWLEYWLQFDGPVAEGLAKAGYFRPDDPVVPPPEGEPFAHDLETLRRVFAEEGPTSDLRAASLVLALVGRAAGADPHRPGRIQDPLVRRALELLDGGGTDAACSPPAIARKLRVSYSTLRRRVRSATGESLKERLLRSRINRAKELLAVTSLAVELVAYKAGFSSASYFVRSFRQREGVTPRQFREKKQGRP